MTKLVTIERDGKIWELEPMAPEGGCPRCGERRLYRVEDGVFSFLCIKCGHEEVDDGLGNHS